MTDNFGSQYGNLMTHANVFYDRSISATTPLGVIGVQFELSNIPKLFDPVIFSLITRLVSELWSICQLHSL